MEDANKLKQFPILITLIIGMSGWLINYLVTNVKSKPIIEYNVEQHLVGENVQYSYTFENVSSNRIYKNITFSFDSKPRCNQALEHGDTISYFRYSNLRFISLIEMHPTYDNRTNDLLIDNIQPNTKLGVFLKVSKASKIQLTYSSEIPVLLTPPTVETFFVKNETLLFFTLLSLYAIIMVFYLLINYKKF